MGLFDSIRATLSCGVCGSRAKREIQTKVGPCLMLNLEVGDIIEPFFYGDYWMEESWYCDDCQRRLLWPSGNGNQRKAERIPRFSTSDRKQWTSCWINC
jgi:hypothetical protein